MSDGMVFFLSLSIPISIVLFVLGCFGFAHYLDVRKYERKRSCHHVYRLHHIEFDEYHSAFKPEHIYHYRCSECKKEETIRERHRAVFEKEFLTDGWEEK